MQIKIVSLCLLLALMLSCGQRGSDSYKKNYVDSTKHSKRFPNDSTGWPTPINETVNSFLEIVKTKRGTNNDFNMVVAKNDFKENWVKRSDIDSLMVLINSKEKCNCFVDPLSSYLPFKDSADLGGYAIKLINSYKKKSKLGFGLWSCPKTNDKDVKDLSEWWTKQSK